MAKVFAFFFLTFSSLCPYLCVLLYWIAKKINDGAFGPRSAPSNSL